MADKFSPVERSMSTPAEKAKNIIEDAFRRADKNDDGSLSLDEFEAYFSDETVSNSQLKQLFTTIDTHNTNNIDISELCDYFSKFWSPFESLFATIDDLNYAVTDCVHKTARHYNEKGFFEQFATRYLMKEALNHIQSVERSLEHVNDSLEETALLERSEEPKLVEQFVGNKQNTTPRWQAKLDKRMKDQSSGNSLNKEISRLAEIVNKLESKIDLSIVEEEEVVSCDDSLVLLVSYNIVVTNDDDLLNIEDYIKQYIDSIKRQDGCNHVMLRKNTDKKKFVIYEVWNDLDTFQSYDGSVVRTTFKNACSKYIKECNQFEVPDSWWPHV